MVQIIKDLIKASATSTLFYRSQKCAECESCRREKQQSESGSWNNEDDVMPHRIPVLPRSNNEKTLISSTIPAPLDIYIENNTTPLYTS